MPYSGRSKLLFTLVFCCACAPICAADPDPTESTPQIVTVKIKLDERSMIIVPVSVNGAGPYDFALDTGCTKTIVDRKLAAGLNLPQVGEKTVLGVLASAKLSVVQVNALSVGGARVRGGEAFSADHAANVTARVRGVLGEDFLRNFDVLIDYRHLVMRLELAPGSMAESAVGEHLPLRLAGTLNGSPTLNRVIIFGRIPELGEEPVSLLLDSGTNQLTLFRDNLGPGSYQPDLVSFGSFSHWVTSTQVMASTILSLKLGHGSRMDLAAIAFPRRDAVDTDGLLPACLFHSVLISHFGRFVILNPSFPKAGGGVLAAR